MSYFYLSCTLLLTVYGQVVIKWQVANAGVFPDTPQGKALFLGKLLLNPWIISALVAAFGAALTWMAALTRLDLSHAYPFLSLTFVLVPVLSVMLFHEPATMPKVVGILLVCAGVIVGSQG